MASPSELHRGESPLTRNLLDAVVDYAIYTLDPNGFILSWNSGAERIKGYSAQEIIGQHFVRFFTPEDQHTGVPFKILSAARADGRFESEGWRVRKDGSRFRALAVIDAIYDDSGNVIGFAKITRDVTERYRTEQALIGSERQFRLLINGIIDYSIFMLDPSGIVTSWNAGAERIKGYRAEEIVGQHFSRFYTPEDRAAGLPARALDAAARTGRSDIEGWRVRRDGSRFWASVVMDAIRDDDGKLVGFAKITRDITERRAAQVAIADSERQFRLLTGSVTDCALYMIDLNGVVVSWNAGAQRIKGYTADEVIGAHFSKFYTESDRLAGVPGRALQAALEHGKYTAEGWRVRKDGSLLWASVVLEAIHDETGATIGFAKMTRDITERRRAQEALEAAQAQLIRSQKMDSLGKLTAGLAHDFNNLLMIVGAQAQTLVKRPLDDAKVTRAVAAIKFAVERGARITRQLLAFARQQPLNPVSFDLRERIDALRDLLSSSAGALVRLELSFPPDLWPVEVDVSELELALVNLAINARDAMPSGGEIELSAENVVLRKSGPTGDLGGEFVALTVADTGTGIPEDILPKIFDPFFTTKDVDKGTGLGLSQVYGFAQQSRGTVTVDSKMGAGTRVTLYLPRSHAGEESKADENATVIEGSEGTILVVDDNPEVALASASLVEELGYKTVLAASADSALKSLAENKAISLVFSDIIMAGPMDGLGLARTIREHFPDLPVLLTTGFSPATQATSDFPILRKPYALSDLARAIAVATKKKSAPDDENLIDLNAVRRGRGAPK